MPPTAPSPVNPGNRHDGTSTPDGVEAAAAGAAGAPPHAGRGTARGERVQVMTPMVEEGALHFDREDPGYGGDEDDDGWSSSPSSPSSPPPAVTPTFNESYTNLKRNLSVKSLRELELKQIQKGLWRRKDEPRKHPRNMDQLLVYATTAGARAFILGYSAKAGVNLVATLIRLLQRKKFKSKIIMQAFLGEDVFRFGGMFGTFVFLWKMAIHLLRLYNPGKKGRQRTESWHAPLAGAISGLAVLAETPRNRVGIAQQLFVRGLQGVYNMLHGRGYVHVPHGEIIIFGLSCGQIMYSWLVSPESLNPGYRHWITGASRVPPAILPWVVARHKRTDQEPPLEQAYKILTRRDITPLNASKVEKIIENAQKGDYGVAFPPCEMVHPWADSCLWTEVLRFKDVFALMVPVYAGLHLIPPVLFKRKQFMKNPLPLLFKSLKGTIRSGCFISTFVVIFQSLVCLRHQTWWFGQTLPKPLRALWLTKYYYWVLGVVTCVSLFIEEQKRRGELAMYVMPKALEAAWSIARRRDYVPFIPGGEVLLTSAALSMVMSTYQHEPGMLSGLVRTIVYQFVGRD